MDFFLTAPILKNLRINLSRMKSVEVKVKKEVEENFETSIVLPDLNTAMEPVEGGEEDVIVMPERPCDAKKRDEKAEELTCPLCPTTFGSQKGAEKHLRMKHDIGNVYICTICQDICPSNTALHEVCMCVT